MENQIKEALLDSADGIMYEPPGMKHVAAVVEDVTRPKASVPILLVDDDVQTCLTLKNLLCPKGYKVRVAYTGKEAITMAREVHDKIIFVDVSRPFINGLETYLAIKRINPQAAAVVMTAHDRDTAKHVEEALKNDAYACLGKPLDAHETLKLVEGILNGK